MKKRDKINEIKMCFICIFKSKRLNFLFNTEMSLSKVFVALLLYCSAASDRLLPSFTSETLLTTSLYSSRILRLIFSEFLSCSSIEDLIKFIRPPRMGNKSVTVGAINPNTAIIILAYKSTIGSKKFF